MKSFTIKATDSSPYVNFNFKSGDITIKGRTFEEDPTVFYNKLHKLLDMVESDIINLHLYLDYVSSSASKKLFKFLKVCKASPKLNAITWHFDEEDTDSEDYGEALSDLIDFEFIMSTDKI